MKLNQINWGSILLLLLIICFVGLAFEHYREVGKLKEQLEFQYKHDSPEDIIRAEDMKLYTNSFEFETDKELRYVKPLDTNSMIPTFDYGHTLVEIACPCDIKAGDIVSFDYNNRSIVHRIISIDSQKVIHTRGDNAKYGEWINESQIKGKVVAILY